MDNLRNCCFTAWEPVTFDEGSMSYLIVGIEICPKTGKTHYQGYVELRNRSRLNKVKGLLGMSTHIEARKGTQEEAITYCKKDGNFTEYGARKVQGKRTDLDTIMAMIKEGKPELEVADANPQLWCQYRKSMQEYRQLTEPKRDWVTEVKYIYGPTGTGKTRAAIEAGAVPVTIGSKRFVMGYNGEDTVLFDDIDEDTFTRQMWLTLTDRYNCNIETKGSFRNWKPKTIYVTSNFDPKRLFKDDPACMRRITEIINLDPIEEMR